MPFRGRSAIIPAPRCGAGASPLRHAGSMLHPDTYLPSVTSARVPRSALGAKGEASAAFSHQQGRVRVPLAHRSLGEGGSAPPIALIHFHNIKDLCGRLARLVPFRGRSAIIPAPRCGAGASPLRHAGSMLHPDTYLPSVTSARVPRSALGAKGEASAAFSHQQGRVRVPLAHRSLGEGGSAPPSARLSGKDGRDWRDSCPLGDGPPLLPFRAKESHPYENRTCELSRDSSRDEEPPALKASGAKGALALSTRGPTS